MDATASFEHNPLLCKLKCPLKDGDERNENSAVINYTFCGEITGNSPLDVEGLSFKLVDVNELNLQRGLLCTGGRI